MKVHVITLNMTLSELAAFTALVETCQEALERQAAGRNDPASAMLNNLKHTVESLKAQATFLATSDTEGVKEMLNTVSDMLIANKTSNPKRDN